MNKLWKEGNSDREAFLSELVFIILQRKFAEQTTLICNDKNSFNLLFMRLKLER